MRTLIYSNLFVAICAAALTMGSYGIVDAEINWHLVLHVLGVTLVAYNIQRLIRLKKFSNRTDQIRWFLEKKWMLYGAVVIGSLISACTFFYLPFKLLLSFAPIAALSFLYSLPFIPKRGDLIAIRDIPGAKIFIIALVWTGVTLLLPLKDAGQLIGIDEVLYMVQRFLFILAITIPFDIRDLKYDDCSLKTIPQMIGYIRSKQLAKGLILICFLIELYHTYGEISYINGVFRVGFYAIVLGLLDRMRADSPDFYFSGVLEGTMLLLGLILTFC